MESVVRSDVIFFLLSEEQKKDEERPEQSGVRAEDSLPALNTMNKSQVSVPLCHFTVGNQN